MSYSADLHLVGDVPELDEVPDYIERASITLNHALLVGELLGTPIGAAQHALDAVSEREDPLLTTSEVQVLRDTCAAVRAALDTAMTPDGRPRPTAAGERLRSSPQLEANATGVLAVRYRYLPLPLLHAQLLAIDALLRHALTHAASVRFGPA